MTSYQFMGVDKKRSKNMAAIKSKGMKPELTVRRLVYNMGCHYRLHRKDIPGRPDLAFIGRKKAIYVHGCFWHQHSDPRCKIVHKPKSNLDYWLPKLKRNKERDRKALSEIKKTGWESLVIWECQTRDDEALTRRIKAFLE